mmetsp:Transcript_84973/g.134228  ORF Transcript_84973/g.134228 Transcript_84973/m.134228 type:complete len:160 (-) Transcript_84973:281-760(-)
MGCTSVKTSVGEPTPSLWKMDRILGNVSPSKRSPRTSWTSRMVSDQMESCRQQKVAEAAKSKEQMAIAIKILCCRDEQVQSYRRENSGDSDCMIDLAEARGIRKGCFVQIPTGQRGRVVNFLRRDTCFVHLYDDPKPLLVHIEHLTILPESLSKEFDAS